MRELPVKKSTLDSFFYTQLKKQNLKNKETQLLPNISKIGVWGLEEGVFTPLLSNLWISQKQNSFPTS
jgi:hypothetical protein